MKLSVVGRILRWSGTKTAAWLVAAVAGVVLPVAAFASELDLEIPAIDTTYTIFGADVTGLSLLYSGLAV
jgi:hypothetical protein